MYKLEKAILWTISFKFGLQFDPFEIRRMDGCSESPSRTPLVTCLTRSYWEFHEICSCTVCVWLWCACADLPYPPLDNIRVMVIVWRLRGNIIRTAPCWAVWHNVHSQQLHTHVSSSHRSSRLFFSHWDPYAHA